MYGIRKIIMEKDKREITDLEELMNPKFFTFHFSIGKDGLDITFGFGFNWIYHRLY